MKTLSDYRQDIERIDQNLLELLSERCECSRGIGALKRAEGLAILDPQREAALLQKYESSMSSLDPIFTRSLFMLIFEESRRLQL